MYSSISTIIALIIITILHPSTASEWNYEERGPAYWVKHYPTCAGRQQSPINIKTICTMYKSFPHFEFSSAYSEDRKFKIVNNGHTVVGTYVGDGKSSPFKMSGGGLQGTYELVNFHLHWGENYNLGSEHQVNGKGYSGEMHLVHQNPSTGQIAVLGMLIQSISHAKREHGKRGGHVHTSSLEEWKIYLQAVKTVPREGNSVEVDLNLSWLETHDLGKFWRYQGSLTTPPCTEGLIWTVFETPIIVRDNEFSILRHNILIKDFRDPQPLNDRIVLRNFDKNKQTPLVELLTCVKP